MEQLSLMAVIRVMELVFIGIENKNANILNFSNEIT